MRLLTYFQNCQIANQFVSLGLSLKHSLWFPKLRLLPVTFCIAVTSSRAGTV